MYRLLLSFYPCFLPPSTNHFPVPSLSASSLVPLPSPVKTAIFSNITLFNAKLLDLLDVLFHPRQHRVYSSIGNGLRCGEHGMNQTVRGRGKGNLILKSSSSLIGIWNKLLIHTHFSGKLWKNWSGLFFCAEPTENDQWGSTEIFFSLFHLLSSCCSLWPKQVLRTEIDHFVIPVNSLLWKFRAWAKLFGFLGAAPALIGR